MKAKRNLNKGLALRLTLFTLLLVGCSGERLTGPEAEPAATAAEASTAAKQAQNGDGPSAWGARVLREVQSCFLPGIAADGTPFPLFDVSCEVQLVLTNNGRIGNSRIRAVVPNEFGRAVKLTFGNPVPLPCFVNFDTDGDGIDDLHRETTRYTLIVSASGRLHLNCQYPDA